MAANAITNSLTTFYNIPGSAASQAVMPIAGKYLGACNQKKAKEMTLTVIALAMLVLGVLSCVLYNFTIPIASVFSKTVEVQRQVSDVLRVTFIITPIFWPLSFVMPSTFRTAGDVKYTTVVAILSMMLFRVLVGYYITIILGWGVMGIGAPCSGLDCPRDPVRLRYLSGRWLRVKLV
jgi:Na+-driven multidrug efflux pump